MTRPASISSNRPRSIVSACIRCIFVTLIALGAKSAIAADGEPALDTEVKKASYVLGYARAGQIIDSTSGVVDLDAFLAGISDRLADRPDRAAGEDTQALFKFLQQEIQARRDAAAADEAKVAQAYRDEFAGKDGVVKLPSGLLYEVMQSGAGDKPGLTDTVVTHYHGTLIDGSVFDSSVQRGQPASFPVNGVIKGWTEALQLMSVGDKWRLVIPPELAYGERGAGRIGPNQTLVFEVELLEIK